MINISGFMRDKNIWWLKKNKVTSSDIIGNFLCPKRSKLICSNISNQISKLIGEIIELGYHKHGGEEISTPS